MKSTITLLLTLAVFGIPSSNSTMIQETKNKDLCVQPAQGPINASSNGASTAASDDTAPQPIIARATVGKEAPDFEANAYVEGGFQPIKLSDYRGQWVVLCFYPGDFTFV